MTVAALERSPTPGLARAATRPPAIVAGGAAVGVGLVAGLPVVAVAGLGILAYVAGTVLSLARRRRPPRPERIDPFTVGETWRRYVRAALQAQARYRRAVGSVAPGPLRERLDEIGRRVDEGAQECWHIAQRGDALDDAVSALGTGRTGDALAAARRGGAGGGSSGIDDAGPEDAGPQDALVRSLQAQVDAAARLTAVSSDAMQRLAVLAARLDEAVATAVELSMQLGSAADSGRLGSDVDHLVEDLAALRSALQETEAIGE